MFLKLTAYHKLKKKCTESSFLSHLGISIFLSSEKVIDPTQ